MRRLLLFVFILGWALASFAKDVPLLIVGTDTVYSEEFLYLWHKHNSYKGESKPETMRSFLETYINYRLKVLDAKAQGLQHRSSFQNEYQQYRDVQLTPYFLDSVKRERLYHEAYERMKWEVDASHILLSVPTDAEDSVVYNRALELRQRLLKGESFDSLARLYSDDPSVAFNGGHLGYFGASTMVYPFEIAAYNTPKDSISFPVRTNFGYHLIRVNNRRPDRGILTVAHIFRSARQDISPERDQEIRDTILLIRSRIQKGEASFYDLVSTFSQDASSLAVNGVLPPVMIGRYPESFVEAAFALKHDSELSAPVRTRFGWHLLYRVKKDSVGSYEASRETIRRSLQRVGIELEGHDALLKIMLEQTNSSVEEDAVLTLLGKNDSVRPSSTELTRPFAHIGTAKKDLLLSELYDYVVENKVAFDKVSLLRAAHNMLNTMVFAYCEHEVRVMHPQLDYLLDEFYDGLLLFDISETKLWQNIPSEEVYKALYKKYKKELLFNTRIKVEEYSTIGSDSKLVDIREKICKTPKPKNVRKQLVRDSIEFRVVNYEAGTSYFTDYGKNSDDAAVVKWDGECSKIFTQANRSIFFRVIESRNRVQKSLDESRGELQRFYQLEEEQRWLSDLRKRYPVRIDEAQFERLERNDVR